MSLIFVDTNIPVYAAGRPHPYKQPCADVLALIASRPAQFVTDAEVLQEILHLYTSRNAWSNGHAVFTMFEAVMGGRVEPILAADVRQAAALVNTHPALSARDLIHLAVMLRLNSPTVVSTDRDFDSIPGIERLDPADLQSWRTRAGF